jgi:hypothetical protein
VAEEACRGGRKSPSVHSERIQFSNGTLFSAQDMHVRYTLSGWARAFRHRVGTLLEA